MLLAATGFDHLVRGPRSIHSTARCLFLVRGLRRKSPERRATGLAQLAHGAIVGMLGLGAVGGGGGGVAVAVAVAAASRRSWCYSGSWHRHQHSAETVCGARLLPEDAL